MKLLVLGVVLVLAIIGTIVTLTTLTYIEYNSNDITIKKDMEFFTEESCVGDSNNKICTQTLYIKNSPNQEKVALMTSHTIKETIIVPKYIEKEKIIYKEKRLLGEERPSPADRISESDVKVYSNRVEISIRNAKWRKFIDSNSMDPLIDAGTTTIEIQPKYASDIKIGDIVAYDVDGFDYAFVHRVIAIKSDQKGIYFVTKGDNFYNADPNKVRFNDIKGIVVGILY